MTHRSLSLCVLRSLWTEFNLDPLSVSVSGVNKAADWKKNFDLRPRNCFSVFLVFEPGTWFRFGADIETRGRHGCPDFLQFRPWVSLSLHVPVIHMHCNHNNSLIIWHSFCLNKHKTRFSAKMASTKVVVSAAQEFLLRFSSCCRRFESRYWLFRKESSSKVEALG